MNNLFFLGESFIKKVNNVLFLFFFQIGEKQINTERVKKALLMPWFPSQEEINICSTEYSCRVRDMT